MRMIAALALLAAPAAFAHNVPAADGSGISYTESISVNPHHKVRIGGVRYYDGPFVAHVHVDVSGVVAERGIASGSVAASFHCPTAAVAKHGDDTWQRTGVAIGTPIQFALSIVSHARIGAKGENHKCWLRVIVRRTGEDEPIRAVLLPVVVEHRMEHNGL